MLLRVVYENGRYDMVKPAVLDTLLEADQIISFKRSSGWAVIGRDPVRMNNHNRNYNGPEKRVDEPVVPKRLLNSGEFTRAVNSM